MFFIKKFISAFLLPLPIFLFLLVLGIYYLFRNSYSKAKLTLFIALSWIALLSFQPIANAILKPLEDTYPSLLKTPKVEYILVLGNGHTSNEKLSITSQVNMVAQNRLNEGIKHYRVLNNAKLVVSGYGGYDKNPHALMQKILTRSLGINQEDVLRIDKAKDTQEEAILFKKIVGNKDFILVTSASHMKRAMLFFKKHGLNPIPAPTNYLSHETKGLSSYFSSQNLYKVEVAFHEYLGLMWAEVLTIIDKYKN